MHISDFIARTVTQRRALVWCGVAVLTIVCIAILLTSLRLDSEIFNVLPGRFPSVQGLKIYDHDFEQTRELTFALVCDPQDVDKLEEFAPVFAERLRGQTWSARVLAGSPMTTADGIRRYRVRSRFFRRRYFPAVVRRRGRMAVAAQLLGWCVAVVAVGRRRGN